MTIAQALIRCRPDRRFGWVHAAHALEHLGRFGEARNLLLAAAKRLEPSVTVPFQLARHCCLDGEQDEGQRWLEECVRIAEDKTELDNVKARILGDSLLAPLAKGLWNK